ncbi:hypothetical protein PoB_000721600 [Plakobranchus ocellatus]|uniref:Uncharacterized protein n=1 Tax=Plakobranchus ocellatus TaxID=259542 RepID=A0AAV3YE70_9GAST|nr:hypothetical protein PoB_000721600 [Plakobranchus ocellatus]
MSSIYFVRSGSNQKTLTCATSRDPRVNFPFVAVLNDSNVASLRLQLDKHLPEFIWVGFEANEDEDIRLSCKLQGFQPTGQGHGNRLPPKNNGNDDVIYSATNTPSENGKIRDEASRKPSDTDLPPKNRKVPIPAILGGATAGLVVVSVLIIIFIVFKRKRKTERSMPEVDESESELDIYYSTTADELRNREIAKSGKRPSKSSTDSQQELYITADQVRANKRRTNSKRVRIISTPDIVEDLGPEQYVSTTQILENKRLSQRKKQSALKRTNLSDEQSIVSGSEQPSPSAASHASYVDNDDHYDRLHRVHKNMAAILESYDQLEPATDTGQQQPYSSAEVKVQRSESKRPLVKSSKETHLEFGNENLAYEDTEVNSPRGESKSLFRITPPKQVAEDRGIYFELELNGSGRNSTASISSTSNGYQQYGLEPSAPPFETDNDSNQSKEVLTVEPTTLPIRGVSRETLCENLALRPGEAIGDTEEEEIYNDGRSEHGPGWRRMSTPTVVPQPFSKPQKRVRASVAGIEPGTPTAAPRRKASLGPVPHSPNYDIAKPIP